MIVIHSFLHSNCIKRSLFLIVVLFSIAFTDALIPSGNPLINYFGRFDFSTANEAKFNWSGSAIEASFTGTSIGIELSDGNADYDVDLDGKHYSVIRTTEKTTKYTISSSLTSGTHTIRIMQRSENHWGTASFKGFYVADGQSLTTPPKKPIRKIEFIGDSYTAGYGNESDGRTCSSAQLRQFTNTNKSFGKITADAFHAECMALGWSGQGMVRNFGDANKKSSTPYPTYYNRTLGALTTAWDFTKWIPDLVVICLGTNDFSTTPYPDDSMYVNAYHAFIATVRTNYANVPILCVGTGCGSMNTLLKTIVTTQQSTYNRKNIYYAELPTNLALTGCDWHPSAADDTLCAKSLIKSIITTVGWDTAATAVAFSHQYNHNAESPITTRFTNKSIILGVTPSLPQADIVITNLNGKVITRQIITSKTPYVFTESTLQKGMYFVTEKNSGTTMKLIF